MSGSSNTYFCKESGCGQTFRRRDYLQRHQAMHSNIRPFTCDSCGKSFGRSDVLKRHQKKCISGSPAPSSNRRRSISPFSPSARKKQRKPTIPYSQPLRQTDNTEVTGGPSGTLALVPIHTRSVRRKSRNGGDEDDESSDASDSSQGSLHLGRSRQTERRDKTDVTILDSSKRGQAGSHGTRMPILDVDFPASEVPVNLTTSGFDAQHEDRGNYLAPYVSGGQMEQPIADMESFLQMDWLDDFDLPIPPVEPLLDFDTYISDASVNIESLFGPTRQAGPSMHGSAASLYPIVPPVPIPYRMDPPVVSSIGAVLRDRVESAPLPNDAFYVPKDRFKAYYRMSHWSLPSLPVLISNAARAKEVILPHFDFLHPPTLRLDMLATCLAFTLCIIGSAPGAGQEGETSWEFGPMVRNEMTIMIMKSFSNSKQMTMTDYNISLNQALFLLQAFEVLSELSHERMRANMFRTTIVNTGRQLECFSPRSSHFRHDIRLPTHPWTPSELDLHWRRWIQLEVRRRTTFVIYIFDMLATIETSIPCICSPSEVSQIPLPAPSSLWLADTSESWLRIANNHTYVSLDSVLRVLFLEQSKEGAENSHTAQPNDMFESQSASHPVTRGLDRFAMHIIILTILRGVIEIGEGRRERGDWYDLTDLWCEREEGEEWIKTNWRKPAGRAALLQAYISAVQVWKSWWDSLPPRQPAPGLGKPALCEEALPVFWLVQSLLNILCSWSPIEVRRAFNTKINLADMLSSARAYTRTGAVVNVPSSSQPAKSG